MKIVHNHSGFISLLQASIAQDITPDNSCQTPKQEAMQENTAHVFYASVLHVQCTSMHEIGFTAADVTNALCKRDV